MPNDRLSVSGVRYSMCYTCTLCQTMQTAMCTDDLLQTSFDVFISMFYAFIVLATDSFGMCTATAFVSLQLFNAATKTVSTT